MLIDASLHAKVADFGTARTLDFDPKDKTALLTMTVVGTVLWMAPEMMGLGKRTYNSRVDIFSHGVVMWELVTHKLPWKEEFTKPNEIRKAVRKGKRLQVSEEARATDLAQTAIARSLHSTTPPQTQGGGATSQRAWQRDQNGGGPTTHSIQRCKPRDEFLVCMHRATSRGSPTGDR